ncbi:hypothetical protein [Microbacterium hydrocarbonoxydans]|uniref:hypothetical protein n=1 Tax=Microbacterium hydrocarbonoxydans TaxID=273678 RepID=UPI003D99351D
MKTFLAAVAALALTVSLASCAAPQPEDAPQTVERVPASAASASSTAPVTPDVHEPSAPAPAMTLTITEVLPMKKTATLDPPDYVSIFEIRDEHEGYFANTAAGPRFLLTHAMSLGNPPAPGNLWQELAVGDGIEALGSNWTITERVEAPKSWPTDDPALEERILGAGPGTLILITCVPRWEGRATHNLIIIAEEAS